MMSQPRIAVLGTGANGSCIAANLVDAGHDVTLIDQWPEHVEAMRRDGLRITIRDGEPHTTRVRAHHLCDVATFREPFDVVLLCFKAYDTRWACELIKPRLKADGLLVGVQNCMAAETIVDVVGAERTVGCVIELSSEMFTPGLVRRNTEPARTWMGLGSLGGGTAARLPELRALLAPAGKVDIKGNILAAKWSKLVVNAMCLGPFAMVGMTLADAIEVPGMRDLIIECGEEALRVGADLGHPVEPIFGLTAAELAGANRPAEKLFDTLASHVGPGRSRNTVLQDLLKGRLSEVEMINGMIAAESEKRGYAAPANARINAIVRRIEAGELKPGVENMELVGR
jgi:2-dehydropantoate 2-reductase